jgi:hypothetical protein
MCPRYEGKPTDPPIWASLPVSSEPVYLTQIRKIGAVNIAHRRSVVNRGPKAARRD